MALVKSNLTGIKCCIVGSCGVGKTSIIKKHLDKNNINTETTLGAIFWTIEHYQDNGNGFKIDFWDTAGQERYNSLIPMYSRNSNIMIITFDITDKVSFQDLHKWIETVSPHCKNSKFLLVGNKNDMELFRQVFEEDVQNFMKTYKNYKMKYFETSARTGYQIKELFEHIFSLAEKIINTDKIQTRIRKINELEYQENIKKDSHSCCLIL